MARKLPRHGGFVLDYLAALHHEHHVLRHCDVIQRIAVEGDDISKFSLLHRPRVISRAQHLRGVYGRCLDRRQRRHPAAHQRAEFPGDELGVVVHAVGDLQVMPERELEGWLLRGQDRSAFGRHDRIGAQRSSLLDNLDFLDDDAPSE